MNLNTTSLSAALAAVLLMIAGAAPADGDATADAANYLRFEQLDDGRCHILSQGGKLMVMHSDHEDKAIRFRLIRYFADVRQQGRATGVAVPGEKPVKLGCTLVDGREQRWTVERAHFEPQEP
ncbi:MAG: hypothetical protein ACU84Q_01920 [Gammaproteobacteria bacterium]